MIPNDSKHILKSIERMKEVDRGAEELVDFRLEVLELIGVARCRSAEVSELNEFAELIESSDTKFFVDAFAEEIDCFKRACHEWLSKQISIPEMSEWDSLEEILEKSADFGLEDDQVQVEEVDYCSQIVYERQRLEFMSLGFTAFSMTGVFDSSFEDRVQGLRQELSSLDQLLSSEESLRRLNCVIELPLVHNLRKISRWKDGAEEECWWLDQTLEKNAADEIEWQKNARKQLNNLAAERVVLPLRSNEDGNWICEHPRLDIQKKEFFVEREFQISLQEGWCEGDWGHFAPIGLVTYKEPNSKGLRLKFEIEVPLDKPVVEPPPVRGHDVVEPTAVLAADTKDGSDDESATELNWQDWVWCFFEDWISVHYRVDLQNSEVEIAVESKRWFKFEWKVEPGQSIGGNASCDSSDATKDHSFPYQANFLFECPSDVERIWVSIWQKEDENELHGSEVEFLDVKTIEDTGRAKLDFTPYPHPANRVGLLCIRRASAGDEYMRFANRVHARNIEYLKGFIQNKFRNLKWLNHDDVLQEVFVKFAIYLRKYGISKFEQSALSADSDGAFSLHRETPVEEIETRIRKKERNFLKTTATRQAIDLIRKRKRLRITHTTDLSEESTDLLSEIAATASPDVSADGELECLSPVEHLLLNYKFHLSYSHKEIAARMKITEDTSKKRLERALKKLKRLPIEEIGNLSLTCQTILNHHLNSKETQQAADKLRQVKRGQPSKTWEELTIEEQTHWTLEHLRHLGIVISKIT